MPLVYLQRIEARIAANPPVEYCSDSHVPCQREVGVIPKSVIPSELEDNLGVWGWHLTVEEMQVARAEAYSLDIPPSQIILFVGQFS